MSVLSSATAPSICAALKKELVMRVIVSGAGIAGLSLALCLRRAAHDVELIEKADHLRDEGYMIDFFGPGYRAAELLGLLPRLREIHYSVERMTFLTPDGHERFSVEYKAFNALTKGRIFNMLRGDLERALFDELRGEVPIRFSTEVTSIEETLSDVHVGFSDGTSQRADLLVGADGVRSKVRRLLFDQDSKYVRYLGYRTAACILERPAEFTELDDAFFTISRPGRQAVVYPIGRGRMATFFVHRAAEPIRSASHDEVCRELEATYGDLGWHLPELLRRQRASKSIFFDSVSQVVMDRWTRGRVALLGDACWCVSLMAGQGASLALAGAYALAEELGRDSDVFAALERYERRLRPPVEEKQRSGRSFAGWFVPQSSLKLAVRDAIVRLSTWSPVMHLMQRTIAGDEAF